jgi:hypothetical protein
MLAAIWFQCLRGHQSCCAPRLRAASQSDRSVGNSVVPVSLRPRLRSSLDTRAKASKCALSLARSSSDSSSRSRSPLCAPSIARISSSSFSYTAVPSLVCVFWIRNTIRNVMMVVPVFIANCQVLLNPNIGPVMAQTTMISTAAANVRGCPVVREVHLAKQSNRVCRDTPLTPLYSHLNKRRY